MTIKLYWCRGKGRSDPNQQNFGDYLSPLLVEMLAGKPVVYAPINRAEMMAIGSILPRERKAKRFFLPHRLHIWGAGDGVRQGVSFFRATPLSCATGCQKLRAGSWFAWQPSPGRSGVAGQSLVGRQGQAGQDAQGRHHSALCRSPASRHNCCIEAAWSVAN